MIMILITIIIGLAFSMVMMSEVYNNRIESYKSTITRIDKMTKITQSFHKTEGDIK